MLNYRRYTDDDFDLVIDLIKSVCVLDAQLAAIEMPMLLKQDDSSFYICEDDKRLVGILGYRKELNQAAKDIYWAEYSYVNPHYQRRGISTRLWDIVENELKNKGCRKLYIDVGNEDEHIIAINQYLSRGYIKEGHCKDFWKDGEDWLIFSKRL